MKRLTLICTLALAFLAGCDSSSSEAPTSPTTTTPPVVTTPVSGVYVSGKVVDPTTGSPVAGVRVGLKKSRLFTHTDKNGNYVISSRSVIAARVAGRVAASDSTQTYVDTTKAALADTTVAATVADSVQVTADTTTLASTEVYSKVDSAVPQIKVVQRNFGGNFQPYAPAGVKVWLEVYKNDSVKTPITNQKLGLMTAMASGTIPGYSGYVYFKYNKDETYDFTVRVIVWNKDSTSITTGSDYLSCESNIGDITFPTLNGSGYIVPSQFLVQGLDTLAVDTSFGIKLAQVGWNGINWHVDTGATLQYTYKFPTAYEPKLVSAGKWGLVMDNATSANRVSGLAFGDTSGVVVRNLVALLSNYGYNNPVAVRDTLLRVVGGKVTWYVSLRKESKKTASYMDSIFKLTITKDSLDAWGASMVAKGDSLHLWDSAYKAGIYVYRDTISCGEFTLAVKTKDSVEIVSTFKNTGTYTPVYEFFYYGSVAPTSYDSVKVSAPAPRWMLSDTQGVFSVPVPAELTAKMKAAEDALAKQVVVCPFVPEALPGGDATARIFAPAASLSWSTSSGWNGIRQYAPSVKFTLTTKFVNHLGTVIGDVGTAQALSVR